MDDSLTQGCSIEWADDNDAETPGKSMNLNSLFRSPTPRSNRSSKSTDATSKVPDSGSTTSSISPHLGTQPLKSSEKKEKSVEDEVDYIFSVMEHNNDGKAKATHGTNSNSVAENARIKESDAGSDVQTPIVGNVQKRLKTNEFNAMLAGLDGLPNIRQRVGTNASQMAGTRQRRKRREMMERAGKRLFKSSANSKKDALKEKSQVGHGTKTKQAISSSNVSSFDDLLLELKETSNGNNDKFNIGENIDERSKLAQEKEYMANQSAHPPLVVKSKNVEPIERNNQVFPEAKPMNDQFDFDDIDFDDDVFAAVDAAVHQRQTQTQTSLSQSQGSRGENALARTPTLPISNKAVDVLHRRKDNTIDVTGTQLESIVTARPSGIVDDVIEDDFADFPMNFDEIDQLVAQRHNTQKIEAKGVEFVSCTRYRICDVVDDTNSYTKALSVALWKDSINLSSKNVKAVGNINLCGEWYHTRCEVGDVMHLCSLSGRHNTEPSALPLTLQTAEKGDDLIMILHPDQLVTPTTISETVDCLRRAILKTRYGSSGLTSRSALVGTMRHSLLETCLLHNNFTKTFAQIESTRIVREHGEQLVGAGLLNEREITSEVLRMLPNIQQFVKTYTNFTGDNCRGNMGGVGHSPSVDICAERVHATEEFAVSTELGLKGYIDVTVEVSSRPAHGILDYMKTITPIRSLMGIELKTGHNQTPQHAHMAQLVLYTIALRTRYGSQIENNYTQGEEFDRAGKGGMLLYLNQAGLNAVHISPDVSELKSLLSQRNVVAAELKRAAAPRGIVIEYDDTEGDERENER